MEVKHGFREYIHKVAIAVDQLGNTLLAGMPNETLSSRSYRNANLTSKKKLRWRIAEKIINIMFFWQPDHCYNSYKTEQDRNHSYSDE